MVTNVSVGPVDSVAVVYLQDGSSVTVPSGETRSLQMISGGICTVSDAVSHDEDEHIPPDGEGDQIRREHGCVLAQHRGQNPR